LSAEDFGFRTPQPGEALDVQFRPYHYYRARQLVQYETTDAPKRIYTEWDLQSALRADTNLLILGQPLEGKSRTLYEIIKQLKGYTVLIPYRDRPLPPESAFSQLLGHKVVVVLRDLNDYAGSVLDIWAFWQRVVRSATTGVIAATCRAGSELAVVRQQLELEGSLSRLYSSIGLKLRFLPPTKEDLARFHADITASHHSSVTGALGSIAMTEQLKIMSQRYAALPAVVQEILHAIKLLVAAGVLPFTQRRIQAVCEHVFGHQIVALDSYLEFLVENGFLRRPGPLIEPEVAYLLHVVPYREGKRPEDDVGALETTLASVGDAQGLFHLGITSREVFKDYDLALRCAEGVCKLRPDNPNAWQSKAEALHALGRTEEMVAAFQQAEAIYARAAEKQLERIQKAIEEKFGPQPASHTDSSQKELEKNPKNKFKEMAEKTELTLQIIEEVTEASVKQPAFISEYLLQLLKTLYHMAIALVTNYEFERWTLMWLATVTFFGGLLVATLLYTAAGLSAQASVIPLLAWAVISGAAGSFIYMVRNCKPEQRTRPIILHFLFASILFWSILFVAVGIILWSG